MAGRDQGAIDTQCAGDLEVMEGIADEENLRG